MQKGNFLKMYKLLKQFYYKFMLQKKFKKIPKDCSFLFFFYKYNSFKDIDRVLLWKFNMLDCMFSVKTRKKKKKKLKNLKKKKLNFSVNLLYITGIKRILLCITFIKLLMLLKCKKKRKNLTMLLFIPLYRYLVFDKKNAVINIKHKIYRRKLMQSQA